MAKSEIQYTASETWRAFVLAVLVMFAAYFLGSRGLIPDSLRGREKAEKARNGQVTNPRKARVGEMPPERQRYLPRPLFEDGHNRPRSERPKRMRR